MVSVSSKIVSDAFGGIVNSLELTAAPTVPSVWIGSIWKTNRVVGPYREVLSPKSGNDRLKDWLISSAVNGLLYISTSSSVPL